jgi:predicted MPP superfamily phosphohydrolase
VIGYVAIAVVVFLALNVMAVLRLLRLHPRRKPWIIAAVVIGNLMWLFFPILNAQTDFSRFIRATLGPPWFAWIAFTFFHMLFTLLSLVLRLPARAASRVFLVAIAIGSVIGCWQALVPLRIERVDVGIANLPPELEGKKLAVLGDLHVGLYTRPSRLTRIFATVTALQPDVALIAGDLLDDDPHFAPKLLAGTRALDRRIPLFAVLGNHEIYGGPAATIAKLRGSRIRLLVNEGAPLGKLWIAGLSDFAAHTPQLAPNFEAALRGMPPGSLPLVLAHQPKAFDGARSRRLPLTICAHTHGGQFGFRPLHWTLAGLFLPFDMGLYRRGTSQLYVNTGTGYWLLPFRLGMTPEITLITLRRAANRVL